MTSDGLLFVVPKSKFFLAILVILKISGGAMRQTAIVLSALTLFGATSVASAAGQDGTFDCATIKEKKVRLSCEKAMKQTAPKAAPLDTNVEARNKFVEVAKRSIAEKMLDPSSVQFHQTYLVESSLHKDGEPTRHVLCGQVNAKNRYGGYVGFKPFYVDAGSNYPGSLHGQVCDTNESSLETSACVMGLTMYCSQAAKNTVELPDS